jgi:hypothetical protein
MKTIFIAFLIAIVAPVFGQQKTEITIVGCAHDSLPNFNAGTLLKILEKVKPTLILHELDSSFFTKDFQFRESLSGNEAAASVRYIGKYPKTRMRPFEFEGRNKFRKEKGIRPTENLAMSLLDSLYHAKALTSEQEALIKKKNTLLDSLKVKATKSPQHFNNSATDSICEMYSTNVYALVNVMNNRTEFATTFCIKPNGEKISYKDGFKLGADFWNLRNKTMARNILRLVEQNPNERIVVLTGFQHRYFLIQELKMLIQDKNIQIKEFYEN